MAVLQKYLPEQMKEDEIAHIVKEAIAACGDNVNMGNVKETCNAKTKGVQMVRLSIILLKNYLDNIYCDINDHSIYSY